MIQTGITNVAGNWCHNVANNISLFLVGLWSLDVFWGLDIVIECVQH